jgi:uncharacterized protein
MDRYDKMRKKLGDQSTIERMTRNFVRLAKKVSKHSKTERNVLETKMDIVEACNKLRTLAVATMMALEDREPNKKTPEDEPIFLHMFAKAVRLDTISDHLRSGDYENDSPDRKKIEKILSSLVWGGADIDVLGREGITAAHMAAMGDSSKLIDFLAERKADLEAFSLLDDGGSTPLMMAAKYGNVHACADLIRHGVDPNQRNGCGMTALHYAGRFGQTRTAKFLLRIGADKTILDADGFTAGRLAMDRYSQRISLFFHKN